MQINMTRNENVKIFENIVHNLELEEECLKAAKISNAFVVETNPCRAFRSK